MSGALVLPFMWIVNQINVPAIKTMEKYKFSLKYLFTNWNSNDKAWSEFLLK